MSKDCGFCMFFSLQNSGAKYVSNKMLTRFQNVSVYLNILAKNIAKGSAETVV